MGEMLFEVTIPGRVGIKKNSKRLIANRKRMLILPSARYGLWEKMALAALTRARAANAQTPLLGPLSAHMVFHFKNRANEPDIDNLLAGPLDVLQKSGVIENDKQVVLITAEKRFGQEPSVEIRLTNYEAEKQVG